MVYYVPENFKILSKGKILIIKGETRLRYKCKVLKVKSYRMRDNSSHNFYIVGWNTKCIPFFLDNDVYY